MEDAVPALLVTREIREHVNVFHTMTDLFNAYIALTMLGLAGTPRQVYELHVLPSLSNETLQSCFSWSVLIWVLVVAQISLRTCCLEASLVLAGSCWQHSLHPGPVQCLVCAHLTAGEGSICVHAACWLGGMCSSAAPDIHHAAGQLHPGTYAGRSSCWMITAMAPWMACGLQWQQVADSRPWISHGRQQRQVWLLCWLTHLPARGRSNACIQSTRACCITGVCCHDFEMAKILAAAKHAFPVCLTVLVHTAGGRRLLRRARQLPGPVVLERAVLVPPGYSSLLYAHGREANSCPQGTELFKVKASLAPGCTHQHRLMQRLCSSAESVC